MFRPTRQSYGVPNDNGAQLVFFYFLQWNKVDKNQHDVPTETRAGLNGFLDSDFRTVRVQSVVGPEGQPGLSVNVTGLQIHPPQPWIPNISHLVCSLFSLLKVCDHGWGVHVRSIFESKALSPASAHASFTLIHETLNSSNDEGTFFFLHGDWTKMMRRRPQNQKNNPVCGGPLKVGETKKKLYVCFRLILLSFPGPGCHSDARWRQQAKTRWSANKVVLYTTTVAV